MGVSTRAHAKINLDLRVLGTRPDGFHELRTVFQAVERRLLRWHPSHREVAL